MLNRHNRLLVSIHIATDAYIQREVISQTSEARITAETIGRRRLTLIVRRGVDGEPDLAGQSKHGPLKYSFAPSKTRNFDARIAPKIDRRKREISHRQT